MVVGKINNRQRPHLGLEWIQEGYVGCALTCAPYVVLARDALPEEDPGHLLEMTISEWEKALNLPPLK